MNRIFWLALGILSIVAGVLALLNPFGATIAAEQLVGWFFLAFGILQGVAFFSAQNQSSRLYAVLGGVIGVLVGVELLLKPLNGILTLTLVIAVLFLAAGVLKLSSAWGLRKTRLLWPLLISGAISTAFGLFILSYFPASARSLLGVLLAIELISNGSVLTVLASHQRPQ